jgi:hypothetical protein
MTVGIISGPHLRVNTKAGAAEGECGADRPIQRNVTGVVGGVYPPNKDLSEICMKEPEPYMEDPGI